MKNFRTFITESAANEPFHSVKVVPAKKDLVDVHMKLALADGGMYGKSKLGTSIPDQPLTHMQVNIGKQRLKGWGQAFPDLHSVGYGTKTYNAHIKAINTVNDSLKATGHAPMSVKQVHVLYDPHRTIIHLGNDKHEMGIMYHQGASARSGQRSFVSNDGAKHRWSAQPFVDPIDGSPNYAHMMHKAKNLEITSHYGPSHDEVSLLAYHGNNDVHKELLSKYAEVRRTGWHAGNRIPLALRQHGSLEIKQAVLNMHPHLTNY